MDKNVPCYGCERRSATCHSSCEDYKVYKQEREAQAEMIRKNKQEDNMVTEIRIRSILRNTKDVTVNRQRARKG